MEYTNAMILVVDDEPNVRSLCKAILERNGFRSILAANGKEGLDLFRVQQHEISLVLADIKMPVMNGVEMVHEIFRLKPHANVIAMSGFGVDLLLPDDLKKLCSSLGKPFTPQELVAAIIKCLEYEEERRRQVIL